MDSEATSQKYSEIFETKNSRMDKVEFVEHKLYMTLNFLKALFKFYVVHSWLLCFIYSENLSSGSFFY